MYSAQGPATAFGDVNGDDLKDFYFGGAKGHEAELHVQQRNGNFIKKKTIAFEEGKTSEDIDAAFFDADNDGDLDLYVVTGGYEFDKDDPMLEDKLYINDGRGNFTPRHLPSMRSSGSCVRPCDFDGDGDIDLFVGGRIVPGRYPEGPESFLLANDGKGNFSVVTLSACAPLKNIGMVTDAAWLDVNNDNQKDLVVVGEWMPVTVFINEQGKLVDKTSDYIPEKTNGFWNTLLVHDFDHDGDFDFIVGNQGLNTQIKPTIEKPAELYYYDFDGNNSTDPLLFHFIKDQSYPFQTRDELIDQLPAFKKKFPKYSDYVTVQLGDILSSEAIEHASKLIAYRFETTYFRNDQGRFSIQSLPLELQFSPVFALAIMDLNGDGSDDLITGGNLERTRARTGLQKGNNGFIFLGDNQGDFQFVSPAATGINIIDDVRRIVTDAGRVFFVTNNNSVRSFRPANKD
jgi:hypothetical protein